MHTWQLQEVKAKLSEVVRLCATEPQIVSVRGTPQVIMMSIAEYAKLIKEKPSLVDFLQNSPWNDVELDLTRDKSLPREVDL